MNNKLSTFLWVLFNGIVAIIITWLVQIDYIYAPLLVPILNLITKEANKFFNPNYPNYVKK